MKYNIINCPAFNKVQYECSSQDTEHICCWMNEDCIMKQIIKKCKYQEKEFDEEIKNGNYPDKYKFFKSGRSDAGTETLNLLEIEEVNDLL